MVALITLYETVRHLIALIIARQLRFFMFLLFMSVVFSHYYSWWAYVNYWNDDFYYQWNHQLFFTLTELLSTALVVHLTNSTNPITSRKVIIIVGIAITHVLGSSWDQFFKNVIKQAGYAHQVTRDVAFMIPDLLHIIIPLLELKRASRLGDGRSVCADIKWDIVMFLSVIVFGTGMCFWL